MPTVTIYPKDGPRWGNSGFTSSTEALKVGKSGTSTYYGRVDFRAINPTWYIKSIKLRMKRVDEYSAKTLIVGSRPDGDWSTKTSTAFSKTISVSSGVATKEWDLTAYKGILQRYTGTWYLHVRHGSGDNSYCEFAGGTGSSAPRLVIEYEEATLSVPGSEFTIDMPSQITAGTAGSGLTHMLSYSIGSASGLLNDGLEINAGEVLHWTPAPALAYEITDGMVGTVTLKLESILNGVLSSTITLNYPLRVPEAYAPTIDSVETVFALVNPPGDDIGVYVQGRSRTECTIVASSVYGAAIEEYRLTIDGKTYTALPGDIPTDPVSITTDVLSSAGVLATTIEAIDSRGQTAKLDRSEAVTVNAYFSPMVTGFSVVRANEAGTAMNDGKYIQVTLSCVFAPLADRNTKRGALRFKSAGDPSFSDPIPLDTAMAAAGEKVYSFTLTGRIGDGAIGPGGYVVSVMLTDRYTTAGDVLAELPSKQIYFDLYSSGEGMAIGGEAVAPSVFDVYLPSRFRESVLFEGAPTYADPSAAIANLFPYCRLSNPTGDTISFNADNRRAWVLNFNTITRCDNGLYEILLGGSGATRRMGWVIPLDGIYRVILAFRASTNTSDGHMGIARLPSTWTPPSANYMLRDTMLSQQIDGTSQYVNRLTTSTGNLSGNMTYDFPANAGDKIWPWLCMLDANKTLLSDETWASIQKIG